MISRKTFEDLSMYKVDHKLMLNQNILPKLKKPQNKNKIKP
jgi:hypothetical protein